MAQYAPLSQLPQSTLYDPSRPLSSVIFPGEDNSYARTDAKKLSHESVTEDNAGRNEYYKIQEWVWELLSWAVGTAIMAGIVFILYKFNDVPVENWPSSIQINTVVAFLSQIAQAALL